MAQLNFNAAAVEPATGRPDPVPGAWYSCAITESGIKPTKDGVGLRLELVFTIIDGEFKGRKIFEGLNIKNASAQAQEIAHKQLSAIAHSVGVLMVEDSSQLHNIPLKVKVKVKAAEGSYDARNEVTAYKNINEMTAGVGAVGGAPAPAAPFVPPALPATAAGAQAGWTPPAAAQPWAAPAASAPAPQWPAPAAAPAAPTSAPAAVAPATLAPAPAAPAIAPAPAVAAPALAIPPWEMPATV
jgi:hypothetical protein